MTFKQRAHQLIDSLPEQPTSEQLEGTLHKLFEEAEIAEGLRDAEEGRTLSNDDLKLRMSRWLTK